MLTQSQSQSVEAADPHVASIFDLGAQPVPTTEMQAAAEAILLTDIPLAAKRRPGRPKKTTNRMENGNGNNKERKKRKSLTPEEKGAISSLIGVLSISMLSFFHEQTTFASDEIANKYNVSRQTIHNLRKKGFPLAPSPKKAKKKILTSEHSKMMEDMLLEDCRTTAGDMKNALQEKFGVKVSISSINKHIRSEEMKRNVGSRYTVKKLELQVDKRNNEQVKEKRKDYVAKYARFIGSLFLFCFAFYFLDLF